MTGRQKKIAFFITLGSCLVAVAIALNVSWIMLHWRSAFPLVVGIILFALIIAGLVIYTIFLTLEIRRNEQHDSFINAVTHELKTPIASIRLYLETLQSRDIGEAQRREFYKVMLDDADRLLYTVEQVLKAGIAGQKKSKAAGAVIELPHLLEECVELARIRHHLPPDALQFEPARAKTSGAAVGKASAGDGGIQSTTVVGDIDDLRTAITNLLDNAVKYSGDKIAITTKVVPAGEGKLRIEVRDHGLGISRGELKAIFGRFYRAPGRDVRKVKGTGLGLFIVRSIAKKHGGRVFAESEGEGKGSTFTLELPRTAS
jgi:two-component system sensor histidine kinase SenX3